MGNKFIEVNKLGKVVLVANMPNEGFYTGQSPSGTFSPDPSCQNPHQRRDDDEPPIYEC